MKNKKCICQGADQYLESGLSIEIRNGNLEFDYTRCRCGSFEDKMEINFCPICGEKLDRRKEVPKELEIYKNLYKFMNGNCENMKGKTPGKGCIGCFYGGTDGKRFYCNEIIDILRDLNKEYKLDEK